MAGLNLELLLFFYNFEIELEMHDIIQYYSVHTKL